MDSNSFIGIGDIYDASTSDSDWASLGQRLFKFFGAHAGTFRFKDADGLYANVFQTSEPGEEKYTNYYFHIDPVRSAILSWNSKAPLVDGNHFRVLFLASTVGIVAAGIGSLLFGRRKENQLKSIAG
jgi:hypothetical protein